jgi:hypothetical protein
MKQKCSKKSRNILDQMQKDLNLNQSQVAQIKALQEKEKPK